MGCYKKNKTEVIKTIIAIILGLVLWYLTVKFVDSGGLKKITPSVAALILLLYSIFLKTLLIFLIGWYGFKLRYINLLCVFYAFLHLLICIITLPLLFLGPSFEHIWSTFSLLSAYIMFRIIGVFIGMKEMTTAAYPENTASKYHFLAPFYKPKRYHSVVIERGKPVTFLKGYVITLLLFFIVEVILSIIKDIFRNFMG